MSLPNCFSEFSCSSLSFPVTAILNSLSVRSQYSMTLSLASGELSFSFCGTFHCGSSRYLMCYPSAGASEVVGTFLLVSELPAWLYLRVGASLLHRLCQRGYSEPLLLILLTRGLLVPYAASVAGITTQGTGRVGSFLVSELQGTLSLWKRKGREKPESHRCLCHAWCCKICRLHHWGWG